MRHHLDLPFPSPAPTPQLRNRNLIPQIPDARIDFDLVVQEFLKGGDVEDFVRGGLRCVDYELSAESALARLDLRRGLWLWFLGWGRGVWLLGIRRGTEAGEGSIAQGIRKIYIKKTHLFRNLSPPSRGTSFPALDGPTAAAASPLGAGFHVFLFTFFSAYCSIYDGWLQSLFLFSPQLLRRGGGGEGGRRQEEGGGRKGEGGKRTVAPAIVCF